LDSPTPFRKQETARRLPRHETDNRVVLTVKRAFGTEKIRGRATNLSEEGFGAVLAGELSLGEVVEARLLLAGLDEPLEVGAQVQNRVGFKHGLKFLEISHEQRRAITRCVREASHEDRITVEAAEAMNAEPEVEPHPEAESEAEAESQAEAGPQAEAEAPAEAEPPAEPEKESPGGGG
jgi:hypothetical protein